jgi:hypothetical protein
LQIAAGAANIRPPNHTTSIGDEVLRTAVVLFALTFWAPAVPAAPFDQYFTDKTMRLDYFHTGKAGTEVVALDEVVCDGPWAGSRTRLVDDTNLGKYYFEVVDPQTNGTIYSRGFASVYGEWETTPEANAIYRTFGESLRFPWPKNPVQVVLKKRQSDNTFREIWSTLVDPNSRFVNAATRPPAGTVTPLFENGPPSEKVDLLLISEGYTAAEMPKFRSDAKRLVAKMFATEPFKSRQKDFNVRLLEFASAESGIHQPRTNQPRRTATGVEYNVFDSERYVLTLDNKRFRDVASAAPYEFVEILVNEEQYGGGGIFNDQATTSVDTAFAEYIFVHEFGHHFAALADEYYTSDVAYTTGAPDKPEPWEPNITALHDPAKLKWRDLVDPGTPLPTPWDKETFEKHTYEAQNKRRELRASGAPESAMNALFRDQQVWDTKLLSSMQYSGKVGAFEGAGYEQKGLYRPEADCIMFTRDEVGFCRVCRRAIERIVDLYARP